MGKFAGEGGQRRQGFNGCAKFRRTRGKKNADGSYLHGCGLKLDFIKRFIYNNSINVTQVLKKLPLWAKVQLELPKSIVLSLILCFIALLQKIELKKAFCKDSELMSQAR